MIEEIDDSLDSAMADLDAARRRIAELELVAEGLSDRVVAREGELRDVREQLDRLHGENEGGLRSLAALADELEAVRSQARGQATRIRMLALREAAAMSERIGELMQEPGMAPERLASALADMLSPGTDTRDGEAEPDTPQVVAKVNGNGSAPRVAEDVFVGSVEVDIGPLSDFSQLVGFEDAAGAIGATREISVTRFAQGRATLAMRLGEPVELLRELEERAPFEFKVRDLRADRVVLDVEDE
jgi:hypothetical protein